MAGLYGSKDQQSKRERLSRFAEALISKRTTGGFDSDWKELDSWLQPRRVRFNQDDKNRSTMRKPNIIDSTARFALRTLESGLHAGLTSPARPWLRLTIRDKQLAARENVKEWLHGCTQILLDTCQQTNLYQALPNVYGDTGGFGTAAMAVLEDDQDVFRCFTYPLGTWAVGVNSRGVASSFVLEYRLSVRQIVEQFAVNGDAATGFDWSNVSTTVKDQWDRGDYEIEHDVVWIVLPNEDANPDRLSPRYLPFKSCHYEKNVNEGKLLRESGFRTFPFMVPRWHVTGGDAYGTDCPGMTAIGDIRQLQIMQRRKAQAINKYVDPPLVGPSMLRTQKTSLLPGDITYQDIREGQAGLRPIHEVALNIEHLRLDTYETRELIRRAFYEDLFLMLARREPAGARGIQPITAREVDELHEEKLLVLGPALDRLHDELLDPLIDRVWDILVTAGMLPEPPEELRGANLIPEYTSVLAQAQKLVGVRSLDAFLISTVQLGATSPDFAARISAKLDINRIVDEYGDRYSVDPRIIRSDDEANATIAEAARAQQADAAAARAQMMARAGKDAAATPLGGNTALSSVMSDAEVVH